MRWRALVWSLKNDNHRRRRRRRPSRHVTDLVAEVNVHGATRHQPALAHLHRHLRGWGRRYGGTM